MWLLHVHSESGDSFASAMEEIFLHGFLDTLKLVPFLFLTYLLMEFIEHKASERVEGFMRKAGTLGPCVGGIVGAVPQCGFSAAASNLFAGRVITVGTLIAVFLSTSDEMLPIMISGGMDPATVALILGYKVVCGIVIGFGVDLLHKLLHRPKDEINIDAICDEDNCHCERGIFYSALHHTLKISAFVLAVTLLINTLVFFVGTEALAAFMDSLPVIGHIVSALFGLVPNCAVSVALTTLYTGGVITAGTMMAGLFSGAGVGILVLFRVNRNIKQNLWIIGILVLSGVVFGLIFDLVFSSLV